MEICGPFVESDAVTVSVGARKDDDIVAVYGVCCEGAVVVWMAEWMSFEGVL